MSLMSAIFAAPKQAVPTKSNPVQAKAKVKGYSEEAFQKQFFKRMGIYTFPTHFEVFDDVNSDGQPSPKDKSLVKLTGYAFDRQRLVDQPKQAEFFLENGYVYVCGPIQGKQQPHFEKSGAGTTAKPQARFEGFVHGDQLSKFQQFFPQLALQDVPTLQNRIIVQNHKEALQKVQTVGKRFGGTGGVSGRSFGRRSPTGTREISSPKQGGAEDRVKISEAQTFGSLVSVSSFTAANGNQYEDIPYSNDSRHLRSLKNGSLAEGYVVVHNNQDGSIPHQHYFFKSSQEASRFVKDNGGSVRGQGWQTGWGN